MENKIFLGGLGGQGVVLGGKLLGMAAVEAHQYATSYSEYAPAMRNGYTYTTLILSDREVGAQVTASYDCMAFFDEESCAAQSQYLKDGGSYIVNTSLVRTMPEENKGTVYLIPASDIAEELKNDRLLNVIMLGAVVEATRGVEPSVMEQVLQSAFGKKSQIAKLNIAAFRRGMETVRSQRAADEEGGSV